MRTYYKIYDGLLADNLFKNQMAVEWPQQYYQSLLIISAVARCAATWPLELELSLPLQ